MSFLLGFFKFLPKGDTAYAWNFLHFLLNSIILLSVRVVQLIATKGPFLQLFIFLKANIGTIIACIKSDANDLRKVGND